MLPLPLRKKKASALCKFEMVTKQPTVVSFHFENSSNGHDKPSSSISGENTDACSLSVPNARGPPKPL